MVLFSAVYWVFFFVASFVLWIPAVVLFLLTAAFGKRRLLLHLYSCFWACFFIYVNPLWKLKVKGRDKLPWKGPAVIVANHASLIDILVVFGLYRPFKWVSKIENFRVPLIGWNMRMNGYVALKRGDRDSVAEMLERCRSYLRKGIPIFMFPEGTRSSNGELREFKDGAFQLALEAGCPVYPVAVKGTAEALPKHGLVLRQHVDAEVVVLDAIHPADLPSVESLKQATREAIAAELSR